MRSSLPDEGTSAAEAPQRGLELAVARLDLVHGYGIAQLLRVCLQLAPRNRADAGELLGKRRLARNDSDRLGEPHPAGRGCDQALDLDEIARQPLTALDLAVLALDVIPGVERTRGEIRARSPGLREPALVHDGHQVDVAQIVTVTLDEGPHQDRADEQVAASLDPLDELRERRPEPKLLRPDATRPVVRDYAATEIRSRKAPSLASA